MWARVRSRCGLPSGRLFMLLTLFRSYRTVLRSWCSSCWRAWHELRRCIRRHPFTSGHELATEPFSPEFVSHQDWAQLREREEACRAGIITRSSPRLVDGEWVTRNSQPCCSNPFRPISSIMARGLLLPSRFGESVGRPRTIRDGFRNQHHHHLCPP